MNGCEDLWLKIRINGNEELIVGVIYRHPGRKYDAFCEKFCNQLDDLNLHKKKYYIVGDFNIDLLKYNLTSNVTSYMQSVQSTGCNFLINRPTRITSHSGTCIDHIYSNLDSDMIENHVILSGISDHFGLLSRIEGVNKSKSQNDTCFRKSNLSETEWENLKDDLKQSLQNEIPFRHMLNPNFLSNSITNTYQNVIDKYMPAKTNSKKKEKAAKRDMDNYHFCRNVSFHNINIYI